MSEVVRLPDGMSRAAAVTLFEDVAASWLQIATGHDRDAANVALYCPPRHREAERAKQRQQATTARDAAAKCLSVASRIAAAEIIVVEG